MIEVETTIIVDFGGPTDQNIIDIRLDPTSNEDKTTFLPGETPVFMAHLSDNLEVENVVPLEGSIKNIGSSNREETFTNIFTSRDPNNLSTYQLPVAPSGTSITYKGRAGSLSSNRHLGGIVKYTSGVDDTPFEAVIDASFPVTLYRLTPPSIELEDNETYVVNIVFYVKEKS